MSKTNYAQTLDGSEGDRPGYTTTTNGESTALYIRASSANGTLSTGNGTTGTATYVPPCPECGVSFGHVVTCPNNIIYPLSKPAAPKPQGWQCPACNTIYAPHVDSCECEIN